MMRIGFRHKKLPNTSPYLDGVNEYAKRLSKYFKLKPVGGEAFRIRFVCGTGRSITSEDLAALLSEARNTGTSQVEVSIVGESERQEREVTENAQKHQAFDINLCDYKIGEELMILLAYEQMYRAARICAGHSYHK